MKKTWTKAVSLLLALIMTLALVACGGDNSNSNDNSSNTTTPPASTNTDSNTSTDNNTPSTPAETSAPIAEGAGYEYIAANVPKLSEEKVSFKLVAYQEVSQNDYNTMEFFKALEAATNVHIDFECFPASSYTDQKNIMLTTGDYGDGFFGYNTLSMADLNEYGPLGLFIEVDDLIDQYCPNYKANVLGAFPTMDGMTTALADGKKYSWGTVNESPARDYPDNLYINKVWLDNLNLEVPTTMEEYYDVLKAFKEQDANGNGDPNDEIPYTFLPINHINGYGSFFGAYGRAEAFNGPGGILNHFVVENGKVVYEPITEEWKTAVKELGKFVQNGLWDQEGFVQDGDMYSGKLTSTTAIVGSAYTWGSGSFGENGDQYIAIAPLKANASASAPMVHKRQNHVSFLSTGFSITNKCSNPEILAQWVDLFYDPYITILAHNGIERVTEIDANGVFSYDESPAADGATFSALTAAEAPKDGAPQCLTNELSINKVKIVTNPDLKADVIAEFYIDQPASVTLPNMQYTEDESLLINDYGVSCQNYVEGCLADWLLGNKDIDADWDAYLAQLQTLKIDDFVAAQQSAYDRTVGK